MLITFLVYAADSVMRNKDTSYKKTEYYFWRIGLH